jgi:hypothetical protein
LQNRTTKIVESIPVYDSMISVLSLSWTLRSFASLVWVASLIASCSTVDSTSAEIRFVSSSLPSEQYPVYA